MESSQAKIVVNDTNIFIELIRLGLLDKFFKLGYVVYTSEFVISELNHSEQQDSVRAYERIGLLTIDSPDEIQMKAAVSILHGAVKLGLTDCTVLELAVRINGTILSSDRSLKEEAAKYQIIINGVLFLMKEMVVVGLLSKAEAIDTLERHKENNKRAPQKECIELIEAWRADVRA